MHIRRHPSSIALTLALPVALVFGALNPVAAQQPAPTAIAARLQPPCTYCGATHADRSAAHAHHGAARADRGAADP
jgi:hypothetical protein